MPRQTPKRMRESKQKNVRVRPEPIARRLEDALDPVKAPSKPKVWADMTPDERAAITASLRRK